MSNRRKRKQTRKQEQRQAREALRATRAARRAEFELGNSLSTEIQVSENDIENEWDDRDPELDDRREKNRILREQRTRKQEQNEDWAA